jgi:hypothetical protein
MTPDSTVAEIETAGVASLWGSTLMSVTARRSKRWWRGWSRNGVASMSWLRMQVEVVVGLWTPKPAPLIRRSCGL